MNRRAAEMVVTLSFAVAALAGTVSAQNAPGSAAIDASTSETAPSVIGSPGPISNSKLRIERVRIKEPVSPSPKPVAIRKKPSRITMRSTFAGRAPIAIRIPISRVRCVTAKCIMPKIPTLESARAITANRLTNSV